MENLHPTPNKLQEKVFQRFLILYGVENNILKIYQFPSTGKWSNPRWCPRCHNFLTICLKMINMMPIRRFWGSRNVMETVKLSFNHHNIIESKMASKMAANRLHQNIIIFLIIYPRMIIMMAIPTFWEIMGCIGNSKIII